MKFTHGGIAAALLIALSGVAYTADAPIPRMPDGRPDFNGTWDNGGGISFLQPKQLEDGSVCVQGCGPAPARAPAAQRQAASQRPTYRPEFHERVRDLDARQQREDPVLRCQPPGVPRIGPPDKIVQTARELVFLYEDVSGPFFRIVPLDPAVQRIDDSESYLGDAHGRWDGDTLVVETGNFNDLTWLVDDGAFHTTSLKVTERLTRHADGVLWEAVADDPEVLAEPWQVPPRQMTLMDREMAEPAPCVEQDLEHMVDDSHHDNPR